MSKNKNTDKHNEHIFLKLLGLLLLVAGLCFGGLTAWRYFSEKETVKDGPKNEPIAVAEKTDVLEDEEKDEEKGETTEGDDNKTHAVEDNNSREEVKVDNNGLKVATINLTAFYDSDIVTAHGSVTNIVEEGGSCTYIFSGPSGKEIIKKTDSMADFHGTLCQAVDLTKGELGSGTWKVILKYKSNSAEGESEAKTFSVQ